MNLPTAERPPCADTLALQRFVDAQAPVYADVCDELRAGHKRSHWMWFIFPQHRDLGHSRLALHYGLRSLREARAYLAHPLLGARLLECTALLLAHPGRSAHELLGTPDDLKLRSCLTLFTLAAPDEALFQQALAQFFGGEADPMTVQLIRRNYE